MNQNGQALIESLLLILLATIITCLGFQVCVIAINDMICNETAFSAMRSISVCNTRTIEHLKNEAEKTALIILLPHLSINNLMYIKTTVWIDETPEGLITLDHNNNPILKCNTAVKYYSNLIFGSNFNKINGFLIQRARARMVKSPDEKYYNKAYPEAPDFD